MTEIKMSKLGKDLIKSMRQAKRVLQGDKAAGRIYTVKIPNKVPVKSIRQKLHLTQVEFCSAYGFSLPTLRKWEQGQRTPEGPARALLAVIAKNPKAVAEALAEYK